ncbi:hypothetical protein Afil01_19840 [Actinorhabdospora filicis]|uniref:TrbC/VIRB2 family protein n=1 Tax=Actinorhabdospora filicis TaxID=1785913 RepID=A0A9W6SJX8_9ACTN|nr:hypothetical protein [Actinorhabdospora filicis]GLZ77177.1 hypothetical protein Afil01_19840 [Actinorhabdospora filicis]
MLRTQLLHEIGPLLAGSAAEIDTKGVIDFFLSKIAPILLAVLGLIFIGRANKGEISRVMTSSAIAIVGLAFIAGAVTLVLFGGSLVNLFFTE